MFTNLRFGFATNSSSTHSIVVLNPQVATPRNTTVQDFGWDHFTASSDQSKVNWLHGCLQSSLETNLPAEMRSKVAGLILGIELEESNVDHQSIPRFPQQHYHWRPELSLEFISDFKEFLLRKDVVILGGNDNTEKKHPLLSKGTKVALPLPLDVGREYKIWCRQEAPKVWTIFDPSEGTRATMDFNNVLEPKPFGKLKTPLLVDLKITDYCSFGCAYCYQGSTPSGQPAEMSYLRNVFAQLSRAKVFEVALGGGEPTTHPKFIEILQQAHYHNMVPNFSTRNIKYFSDENLSKVLKLIGGFAISVDSANAVKAWAKRLSDYDIKQMHVSPSALDKASIQYVLGSTSFEDFQKIVKAARPFDRITLLGWKTTGRGSSVAPYDYTGWLDLVAKNFYQVGIDTCVAQMHGEEIKARGIDPRLYSLEEGQQSMYIDAVERKAGASSFVEDAAYIPYDKVTEIAGLFERL